MVRQWAGAGRQRGLDADCPGAGSAPALRHDWSVADTALAALVTHNDPASTASCLAYIYILWQVLQMPAPPPPRPLC